MIYYTAIVSIYLVINGQYNEDTIPYAILSENDDSLEKTL